MYKYTVAIADIAGTTTYTVTATDGHDAMRQAWYQRAKYESFSVTSITLTRL